MFDAFNMRSADYSQFRHTKKLSVCDMLFRPGSCFGFGLIGMAFAVAATHYGIDYYSDDMRRAGAWIAEPWSAASCYVITSGVSYRGDCWVANEVYSECSENGPQLQNSTNYKEKVATACIDHGDRIWELAHQNQRRLGCESFYLPWVLVEMPSGQRRCSFRWGAEIPSTETSKESALSYIQQFPAGMNTTCQAYPEQDCIVALQYPMDALQSWFSSSVVYTGAAVFASVGLLICAISLVYSCFHDEMLNELGEATPMVTFTSHMDDDAKKERALELRYGDTENGGCCE